MVSTRLRRLLPGVATLAVALTALAGPLAPAATGSAAPRVARPDPLRVARVVRDVAGGPVGVVSAQATTAAAQRAVRAYWTPARAAAARPVELSSPVVGRPVPATASGRAARGPAVDAVAGRLTPSRTAVVTGAAWPFGGVVVRTTGKVFFTLGGADYVCSGSAVDSPDASTVLTAGHCVNEGGDGLVAGASATNWAFVPGYHDGVRPYGTFTATRLATTTGWAQDGDFEVDVAFADVGTNAAGQTLGAAVGGQPIAFGLARGGGAVALGYPAAAPYTGQALRYCSGSLLADTFYGTGDQGLLCGMTPGSSGGPWLAGLNRRTGIGTLVSVTSYSYTEHPGRLWGPYLGSVAQALYAAVASTTGA
jgi:V8-like Glu-specific endopeptidase